MSGFRGLFIFLLALTLIFISIRSTIPPPVKTGRQADSAFSLQRATVHLNSIAALPHSTGTGRHRFVRDYIVNACTQFGFTVDLQATTSVRTRRNRVQAADIQNIIARKKGTRPGKVIVLMAHYDTEPNTPGAGDDGAGVAAMLETARALQQSTPLKNDILLLFSDAEEIGLLGAKAFVEEHASVKDIAIVINFEGRGNAGPSSMFEVNPGNGWAVSGYAASATHPFANSLGYEVYKNLPNSTDYTFFKDAGITGLNNAYIDGFANYHSMNDKPANIDLRSIQHHGENMISLTRHFGNLDITNTKAPDRTYFNAIGFRLVHYPASWNIVFVVLVNILFAVYLMLGFKKRIFKIGSLSLSSIIFPVALVIVYFLSSFLLKAVLKFYPLYKHFDENNSYNSHWYFGAVAALAVSFITLLYWLLSRKMRVVTLYGGILLLLIILMNGIQYAAPSASYLLYIPLLFILPVQCFFLVKNVTFIHQPLKWNVLSFAGAIPAICLLSPVIYYAFIAFALGENFPFIAVATALFSGMLVHLILPTFDLRLPWVSLALLVCFVAGIIGAHTGSGYTLTEPLPSSLYYSLDADSLKATWRSDFGTTDKFTSRFFKDNVPGNSVGARLIADAPLLPLAVPTATIITDSVENDIRKLETHFEVNDPGVNLVGVQMENPREVNLKSINGKPVSQSEATTPGYITFYGPGVKGFTALFEMNSSTKLNLQVTASAIGLPAGAKALVRYPADIIPAQGRSNTTQVSKHFHF